MTFSNPFCFITNVLIRCCCWQPAKFTHIQHFWRDPTTKHHEVSYVVTWQTKWPGLTSPSNAPEICQWAHHTVTLNRQKFTLLKSFNFVFLHLQKCDILQHTKIRGCQNWSSWRQSDWAPNSTSHLCYSNKYKEHTSNGSEQVTYIFLIL